MKKRARGVRLFALGMMAVLCLCFAGAAESYAIGMSPSGGATVTDRYPEFSWPETPGATWYQLWIIRNGKAYETPWVQGSTAWTPGRAFEGGAYQWWVRAWGPAIGMTGWSSVAVFQIPLQTPGALALIEPEGEQATHALAYRWNKDIAATWYHLYVLRSGAGAWHDRWFALSGEGEAAVEPGGAHPGVAKPIPAAPTGSIENAQPTFEWSGGTHTWWVRAWGPDGMGPWSKAMSFSIPQPAGSWHRVYAIRTGGPEVIDAWTTGENLPSPVVLQDGAYSWWLGVWDAHAGRTIWSDRMEFDQDLRQAEEGLGEDEADIDAETELLAAFQEAVENGGAGAAVTIADFPANDYSYESHMEDTGDTYTEEERRLFHSSPVTYDYVPSLNGISSESAPPRVRVHEPAQTMEKSNASGDFRVRFPGAVFTDAQGNRTRGDILVQGNVVTAGHFSFDFGSTALGWLPPSIGARSWDTWETMPPFFDPYPPICREGAASTWNGRVFTLTQTRFHACFATDQTTSEFYDFSIQHGWEYLCRNGPLARKATVSFTYSVFENGQLTAHQEAFYIHYF